MVNKWVNIFMAVIIALFIIGCKTTPSISAGTDESIVVVRGPSAEWVDPKFNVWLNGEMVASGRGTIRFVIPNGKHTIKAGGSLLSIGNELNFNANGEEITFRVREKSSPLVLLLVNVYNITEISRKKL